MYEELIKDLRNWAYPAWGNYEGYAELLKSAADEIETLNRKLKVYEDAEDQGRLIVLPCKVGDTVYVLAKERTINEYNIGGVIIDHNNIWLDAKDGIYGGGLLNSLQFGLDVFLSREEAEKALENMK